MTEIPITAINLFLIVIKTPLSQIAVAKIISLLLKVELKMEIEEKIQHRNKVLKRVTINVFKETANRLAQVPISVLRIEENDVLYVYLVFYVQQHVNHESSYLQVLR